MWIPRASLALVVGTTILWATACGERDGHPSTLPGTTAPRPSTHAIGPPTTLPWWSHGLLHVDEGVIRTDLHEIAARGGTVLVGRTSVHHSTWLILRGDALRPVISTADQGVEPVVSANGRHVAWVTSRVLRRFDRYTTDSLFTVHAYDVGAGRQVATTRVESRAQCCDQSGVIHVAGVDNRGAVVVVRDYDHAWFWRPGRAAVSATGELQPRAVTGNDQWPGGLSWSTTGDSTGPAAFGSVDRSGVTTVVGRVPQGQGGLWSPDASSYVYQPFTKAAGGPPPVVWTSGGRVRLRAPEGASPVGWESARSVVVRTDHRPMVLLRCDARTGRCEQAGQALRHAVMAVPYVA